MTAPEPDRYESPEACVDAILSRVGKTIVLGLPLGVGKPNHLANALYERAAADPSISLRIFTALTMERPHPSSDLERRLIEPILERLLGPDYPDLAYATARRKMRIPDNITVQEFFLSPGALLGNPIAQQNYISTNYTHGARDVLASGLNVLAQMVRPSPREGLSRLSLSSNPDLALDVMAALQAKREAGENVMILGEINDRLPYLDNDAAVPGSSFDGVIEPAPYAMFGPVAEAVALRDYAIGLNCSALVRDGGTLQIGFGSLGDAVCKSLILRHKTNDAYRAILGALSSSFGNLGPAGPLGGDAPFQKGLYGSSEMIFDGFLHLLEAGVLTREVYEDCDLQRAANAGENVDADGFVLEGAFYLGTKHFYDRLRAMSFEECARFNMTSVTKINDLFGDEGLRRLQRLHARFINSALMVTAMGATVSDGLEDGRVVSGVGGQSNFVTMAHELEDGRSIICLRSTRTAKGRTTSNIVWNYGHITVPRHLRDVVVSEYGIAELRGQTDRDCIVRMLNICDSRFQDTLLDEAKRCGKIEQGYVIPDAHRRNTPERLKAALEPFAEHLPPFPFGTDLTDTELTLGAALRPLKDEMATPFGKARTLLSALGQIALPKSAMPYLERLGLDHPRSLTERFYAMLVAAQLNRQGKL